MKKTARNIILAAITSSFTSACTYPRVEGPYTFDRVRPEYTLRTTDQRAVESTIEELERVPDYLQLIGNRHGNIVLFSGSITDQPEFEQYRAERHPTAGNWEHIEGCYQTQRRQIFINVYQSPRNNHHLELHEYGHLIDHALGHASERPTFRHVFERCANETLLGFSLLSPHESSHPTEFFAVCFANFYHSNVSRERLQRKHPLAFEYFERLDESLNR